MNVMQQIQKYKIVPVVVANSVGQGKDILQGLQEGGLPVAEVCFRTPCAKEVLNYAVSTCPEMLVGAGTVINAEQCREAIECGAKFIVSPGLSEEVATVCKQCNVLYLPGVVTPTEVMKAISLGITTLKFFPASNFGGLLTIKSLCSAFPQVKFMPTGGINENNVLEYLSYDKIIACGGSWMTKGTREEVAQKSKSAVALVGGKK